MDSNWQGERSERASEASEASGAIRMNLDVEKARDAEEGPRGSMSNWSNQKFQHHRRCTLIPSNASRGHEDCVGKDVSHVLPRFFIATRFPFYVKAGFFLLFFHCFFQYFGSAKASKLDLNLELCWRSSWEASWSDVGPMLGGFWESSWSQVGPKTVQNGAMTGQVGAKMAQDGAKTAQDGAKTG